MLESIPAGWPCALLPAEPPSVADRQSNPSADEILPQVLALTPRGAAWGADEAGDGKGASPVQRSFWRGIAAWVADLNIRDWTIATQTFPSAATVSLPDWEAELGLPDPCMPAGRTAEQRVSRVRARFGAQGGASPAYFVCVAASLGFTMRVEEPTQFLCDVSECVAFDTLDTYFTCDEAECGEDGDPIEGYAFPSAADPGDEVAGGALNETYFACDEGECGEDGDRIEGFDPNDPGAVAWRFWVADVVTAPATYFRCDEAECGAEGDRIEGYTPAPDLECVLARLSPPHTTLVFRYPD
ncbi:hypothetical protein ASF28_08885 [Methylobacterium sp. Leaf99]|uniref:putative phage tail protein n=1 Tax=Methylobacterium sp. Leaf99 TaxID=1736251 RepID=UPI0006FFCFB9|nr:putative phage tail protein [Methylobacterium sp. Leaf99]KQP11148.1 hypothetical protein ASF28_08885 [Methylobacterium sp. Leaf99]